LKRNPNSALPEDLLYRTRQIEKNRRTEQKIKKSNTKQQNEIKEILRIVKDRKSSELFDDDWRENG
jgi:hypothetical protein